MSKVNVDDKKKVFTINWEEIGGVVASEHKYSPGPIKPEDGFEPDYGKREIILSINCEFEVEYIECNGKRYVKD